MCEPLLVGNTDGWCPRGLWARLPRRAGQAGTSPSSLGADAGFGRKTTAANCCRSRCGSARPLRGQRPSQGILPAASFHRSPRRSRARRRTTRDRMRNDIDWMSRSRNSLRMFRLYVARSPIGSFRSITASPPVVLRGGFAGGEAADGAPSCRPRDRLSVGRAALSRWGSGKKAQQRGRHLLRQRDRTHALGPGATTT
jgi:hypothetical protein